MLERIIISAASLIWLLCGVVAADDLERQTRALGVIRETAADICLTIPPEGGKQHLEASGEVKAKLGGAAAKIVDLGITGAGKYIDHQWRGILQQELAQLFKDNATCRLEVLKALQDKMLGRPASQLKQVKPAVGSAPAGRADHTIIQESRGNNSPNIVGSGNVFNSR